MLCLCIYLSIYLSIHAFASGPKTAAVFFAFVFQVLRNGLLGTYLTHAKSCDNVRVPSATQWTASVQTCDNVRVPNATQRTASVPT